MDCSPPGSSVQGILQARILEWVACPPLGDLSNPWIEPGSPASCASQADFSPLSHQGSPSCVSEQIRSVAQSCPTLCDLMNCSTPGLSVHHQLPEFTETHIHRVSDAIQPSYPLSSPSPLVYSILQISTRTVFLKVWAVDHT